MTIREVWNSNVIEEFILIKNLIPSTPYASFDMEYPGTLFRPNIPKHLLSSLSPADNYAYMKANVDILKLIQVGLTLSTEPNPRTGAVNSFTWQFHINDFDIDSDFQNPESIDLLRRHGIDFNKNRSYGINSNWFGYLLIQSGVLGCAPHRTWVTFHGAYDFGFLIKILTQSFLPPNLFVFMGIVRSFFGETIFDVKYLMKFSRGIYGGLNQAANRLGVNRVAGVSHQAGSDSLLTMHVFFRLKTICFNSQYSDYYLSPFRNILYGFQLPFPYQPQSISNLTWIRQPSTSNI